MVRVGALPVVHYEAPMGIWEGAPIHYHLVKGLMRVSWRALVSHVDNLSFSVGLGPVASTPFSQFQAEHLLEAEDEGLTIRDSLDFVTTDLALDETLAQAMCVYAFDSRKLASQGDAGAPTSAMDSLSQSQQAG